MARVGGRVSLNWSNAIVPLQSCMQDFSYALLFGALPADLQAFLSIGAYLRTDPHRQGASVARRPLRSKLFPARSVLCTLLLQLERLCRWLFRLCRLERH